MGHRMKNYGLAAGPRSTMHLSVSEECKKKKKRKKTQPTRHGGERITARFASSRGSTENTFSTKLRSNLFCVFITKSLS